MVLGQAPRPAAGQQREHCPDQGRFEAPARHQPEVGVLVEQLAAKGGPFGGAAVAPEPQAIFPAQPLGSRGAILPRARRDHAGQSQEDPAQGVDQEQRPPEQPGLAHGIVGGVKGRVVIAAGAREQEDPRHLLGTPDKSQPGPNRRAYRGEQENQQEGHPHGAARVAAQRRHANSRRQGKEQGVDGHQRHAAELAGCDAAQQHRQGQHRHHRQHPVEAVERGRCQLARHHVVAFQVGQEQQAQRSLALFLAETVRRVAHAAEQAVKDCAAGEQPEQKLGDPMGRLVLHHKKEPGANGHDRESRAAALPVGAAPP